MSTIGGAVRAFGRSKSGNVAMLFGLAAIPLMVGVGAAVDYGRALLVRERMGNAADAAALAVGSWQGQTKAQLQVKRGNTSTRTFRRRFSALPPRSTSISLETTSS